MDIIKPSPSKDLVAEVILEHGIHMAMLKDQ